MQHYYYARYPTDDWHLAYIFSLVYFSVDVCLVGVLLAQGEIPVSGSVHPSRWLPPSRENKSQLGVTRFPTWAKWGGIWTDTWVCMHYWVVIWVAGFLNSPLYCAVYGVCHGQDTSRPYGRISYNLLPTIIIIIQECSQAWEICNCLLSLYCGVCLTCC